MLRKSITQCAVALAFTLGSTACGSTVSGSASSVENVAPAVESGMEDAVDPAEEPASVASDVGLDRETLETSGSLIIYSGRSESLVGPLIEQFEIETGLDVEVRYGGTAEMAATILEEGDNRPADLFYGQDAGALGELARAGRFVPLPDELLDQVGDARFRSPEGLWVGTSGRARTVVYNTENVSETDLPDDIFGFCDTRWQGRIGWAPTNGSFQAFITALRVIEGEAQAKAWLECIIANDPQVYPKNTPIVEATGRGEIDVGFVNHYYLFRFLSEDPDFPARNYHLPAGDAGAMVNVAGAGILNTAANPTAAETFIRYMLSETGQTYFNTETNEYPLSANIELNALLVPLEQIETPDIDLSNLDDLDGTLQLLQAVGAL
jgi:iron(III) transport system substrate-binding protein